ncbi:MAG: hypothetical protein H6727_08975 [Myxococcales bacterium]|nr:hypothetical protein [Myxococcales bacterium]
MAKIKKMRAYQMAEQLTMPFKNFRHYAQKQGYHLQTTKASLPVEEARALIEAIRRTMVLESEEALATQAALSPSFQDAVLEVSDSGGYTTLDQIAAWTASAAETHKDSGNSPAFFLAEMIETGGESGSLASYEMLSDSLDVSVLPCSDTQDAPVSAVWEGPSQSTLLCPVAFCFEHRATLMGDRVFVVGDCAELGAWDPARGVELEPSAWPLWKASILLPQGTSFAFKLVQKTPRGFVWEQGPNRQARCDGDGSVCLEGCFR